MPETRSDSRIAEAAAGGEDKEKYVRQIFSEIAPRYDLLNHILSFNIDKQWRTRALREIDWERAASGQLLDLCAGTLDVSLALAKQKGFNGSVVAADFAEPMLRAGIRKVAGRAVFPVTADALALPFPDDSMDGAIVAFGARNLSDLDAGLREVHRVLRPRSRFVILEFTTPRSALVRLVYLSYFTRVLPLVGRLVSGHPTAYRYLPASVAKFPDERALAAKMQDAGFKAVRFISLSLGVAAVHVGEKS